MSQEIQHFSSSIPHLQVAWDATSLADFRRCPRYYQYRHIECWRGKKDNDNLIFGTLVHECAEAYDNALARGVPYADAVRMSIRKLLVATKDWKTEDKYKNRFTLLRTMVWYFDQFEHDVFKTAMRPDGGPAVEFSFRLPLPIDTPDGKPYLLCGHIDKVVHEGNHFQFIDRKTTKYTLSGDYFKRYSPDTQMSCYSVAIRVLFNTPIVHGLIDAAQVAVNFTRFQRGATHRSTAQMDEWVKDTMYWIRKAEECAREAYWPMNDQACNLWGGCPFRGICSLDPASRERFLEADFMKGERWNPLRVRGE